jgi:hypothetical protein
MAKKVKAKVIKRGRKKKRIPSVVYRLTWSLDPVAHAGLIAVLESLPPRQRSQYILDIVLGNARFEIKAPTVQSEAVAEKEIDIAGDGW